MAKQTLKEAVHLAGTGKSRDLARAALALHGKPVGGWGETAQAMRDISEALPLRSLRAYSLEEFIGAVYEVDGSDRYRTKESK